MPGGVLSAGRLGGQCWEEPAAHTSHLSIRTSVRVYILLLSVYRPVDLFVICYHSSLSVYHPSSLQGCGLNPPGLGPAGSLASTVERGEREEALLSPLQLVAGSLLALHAARAQPHPWLCPPSRPPPPGSVGQPGPLPLSSPQAWGRKPLPAPQGLQHLCDQP